MYLPFIRAINLVSGNTIFCLGYSHFGMNWPYFLGKIFQLLQPHFDIIIEQCIKLLYNFHFNIWFDEIFEHNAIQHHRAPGWIFSMLFVLFFSLMITDDALRIFRKFEKHKIKIKIMITKSLLFIILTGTPEYRHCLILNLSVRCSGYALRILKWTEKCCFVYISS